MFCTVTTTIKDPSDRPIPGAVVYFTLDRGAYTEDAQYPRGTLRIVANAQGEISADLWIDSTGLVHTNWVVRLPSGGNWRFSIPPNTSTTRLEDLLPHNHCPPIPGPNPGIDVAIALHNADPNAHPGLGGGTDAPLPEYPAGSALSALRMVRLVAGQLTICDAANAAHAGTAIGVTTQGLAIDTLHAPKRFGLLTDLSWSWDPSKPVYAGAGGVLTQSLAGLAFALAIATVVSPDTIFINHQQEIRL